MPMVIPAGSYLAKLRWTLQGDPEEMISTIGVTPTEGLDRNVVDIAHAVWAAWEGAWAANTMAPQYSFVGVDVMAASTGAGSPSGSYDEVLVGAGEASPLPQNCCVLAKKKTALSGHRNSGRMYLPAGYTQDNGVDAVGRITPSIHADYQTRMNQFWTNLQDESPELGFGVLMALKPVLFHSIGSTDATDITNFVVDPIIATQRQRLRR